MFFCISRNFAKLATLRGGEQFFIVTNKNDFVRSGDIVAFKYHDQHWLSNCPIRRRKSPTSINTKTCPGDKFESLQTSDRCRDERWKIEALGKNNGEVIEHLDLVRIVTNYDHSRQITMMDIAYELSMVTKVLDISTFYNWIIFDVHKENIYDI